MFESKCKCGRFYPKWSGQMQNWLGWKSRPMPYTGQQVCSNCGRQPPMKLKNNLRNDAQFLIDRLGEFAPDDLSERSARDWHGHIEPAIERVKIALRARNG